MVLVKYELDFRKHIPTNSSLFQLNGFIFKGMNLRMHTDPVLNHLNHKTVLLKNER